MLKIQLMFVPATEAVAATWTMFARVGEYYAVSWYTAKPTRKQKSQFKRYAFKTLKPCIAAVKLLSMSDSEFANKFR